MAHPAKRFWAIFFELYEPLPRQGPGNRACFEKALALCDGLPPKAKVLDLGCGSGAQTLHLAESTAGPIMALDSHRPSIERLKRTVAELGLKERIHPTVGDMATPHQEDASFDLIWSEGALYNIGIEPALQICERLLRPGGYLAFTEAVWLKSEPPAKVKTSFEEYPGMGTVSGVIAKIENSRFSLVDHFPLPAEAWWHDFYTPMEARIRELKERYRDDSEALLILDQLAEEPKMHRKYGDYYGYEFFVCRRDVVEQLFGLGH